MISTRPTYCSSWDKQNINGLGLDSIKKRFQKVPIQK